MATEKDHTHARADEETEKHKEGAKLPTETTHNLKIHANAEDFWILNKISEKKS